MAHLLGNRYCIESLRSDVTDLQEAVIGVFSRIGPVRHPSWKYPDKMSCDLDLTELLEIHDYSEDEEERQVAHIVLLELVIDRLVLLLQAMSKYTEQMTVTKNSRGTSAHNTATNSSLGLVVKKYWAKLVQLQAVLQEVRAENKNSQRAIYDLEQMVSKLSHGADACNNSAGSASIPSQASIPPNNSKISKRLSNASEMDISRDEYNKSTQTLETAFVPCESCHFVQKHFRDMGKSVVALCTSQELPSSLAKFMAQVQNIQWLNGNDVVRWAVEQNKDLARIEKQMGYLITLKEELEAEQKRNRELQERLQEQDRELKLERETQWTQQTQYETKIQGIEKSNKNSLAEMKRERTELEEKKRQTEEQLREMKQRAEKQDEVLATFEETKARLLEEMETSMTPVENVRHLEGMNSQLQGELETAKLNAATAEKQLKRETAKCQSMETHMKAIQDKQVSLLEQCNSLDQENDELREQVADLEQEKESLECLLEKAQDGQKEAELRLKAEQEHVQRITEDKNLAEQSRGDLQQDVQHLEQKLQKAQEQERLLVEYPDLNGPVNPDFSGSGDIAQDMEKQVKANSLRIDILKEQNSKLRHSISRMLQSRGGQSLSATVSQLPSQPLALWQRNPELAVESADNSRSASTSAWSEDTLPWSTNNSPSPTTHNNHTPHPPPPPAGHKMKTPASAPNQARQSFVVTKGPGGRPNSGKTLGKLSTKAANGVASNGGSSIAAYAELKKAGLLNMQSGNKRPSSGKAMAPPVGGNTNQSPMFTCPKCDKMYNNMQDLQLHRSYCYGGI